MYYETKTHIYYTCSCSKVGMAFTVLKAIKVILHTTQVVPLNFNIKEAVD